MTSNLQTGNAEQGEKEFASQTKNTKAQLLK